MPSRPPTRRPEPRRGGSGTGRTPINPIAKPPWARREPHRPEPMVRLGGHETLWRAQAAAMREARGMPPRKMPMAEVVRPRLSRRHERTFARGIDTLLAERGRVRVPISRRGIFGRGRALVRVETNLGPVIELHEQPSTLGRLFGRRGKVRRVWARP